MRIGIYAPNVGEKEPSGVERYVVELIRALVSTGSGHEFVLITDANHWPESPCWRRVPLPHMGKLSRLYHDHVGLRKIVREEKLDLLHSPKSTLPSGLSCPSVMTVHDVIFLRHGSSYPAWFRWYWSRTLNRSVERATKILCVSKTTAKDVEELLPGSRGKVHPVQSGVNLAAFASLSAERGEDVRKRLGVSPPYFFFVGNITIRKNIPFLVDAFATIRNEFPGTLVLAGGHDYGSEGIVRKLSGDAVRFVGRVSDEELAALYQGAVALVYPSKYEGFGLQALEAMAAGCPVVASTGGALPEVVGDAGILQDPEDAQAWADAMIRLWKDDGFRRDLVGKGRERLEDFTWERTAQKTMELYEQAVNAS